MNYFNLDRRKCSSIKLQLLQQMFLRNIGRYSLNVNTLRMTSFEMSINRKKKKRKLERLEWTRKRKTKLNLTWSRFLKFDTQT